jgi:hypothetical protein
MTPAKFGVALARSRTSAVSSSAWNPPEPTTDHTTRFSGRMATVYCANGGCSRPSRASDALDCTTMMLGTPRKNAPSTGVIVNRRPMWE